jgi:hypothetical protein
MSLPGPYHLPGRLFRGYAILSIPLHPGVDFRPFKTDETTYPIVGNLILLHHGISAFGANSEIDGKPLDAQEGAFLN